MEPIGINSVILTLFATVFAGGPCLARLLDVARVMLTTHGPRATWWVFPRSYHGPTSTRWVVVGELEASLCALAYSSAERNIDPPSPGYVPLTRIERWVPGVFAVLHFAMGLAQLIAR